MSLRETIARAIYEQPKEDGTTDDWSALSEKRKEAWRADADRVLDVLPEDLRRMRAALLWLLGHIELADGYEIDVDKAHDAAAWGLGKINVNSKLRSELEAKARVGGDSE